MKRYQLWIPLLLIIIALGGFLRAYHLPTQSYWMDEGFTINAVQAIEERGTQVLDSGFTYTCPLYCYPTAGIAKVFRDSPASYRALATVAGTVFIGAIFFIVRRMFDVRVALLASAFTAFSYFQIAWSRQARWYTLFELFFWLALFFFHRALYQESSRPRDRILTVSLTALFTALAGLTHDLGFILPLIFAAWLAIDGVRRGWITKQTFITLAVAGIAAVAGAALYLQLEPAFVLPFYLNFYLRSYWVVLVLAIIGIIHPSNRYRKETALLGLVGLAYVIPLSFLSDIVNYRYLFHLTPVLFILTSLGVLALMSDLPKRFKPWQRAAIVIPAVFIVFFISGQGVLVPRTHYFLESDDPSSFYLKNRRSFIFVPQPEWNGAYEYIRANKQLGEAVITSDPSFNKIFLGEPGYWFRFKYNGKDYQKETDDDREFYVGARIVNDAAEFAGITSSSTGYAVIDSYAKRHVSQEINDALDAMTEVYHVKTNSYSEIWVYRF